MKSLIIKASAMLTLGIIGIGYAIEFLFTIISMNLNLPGPYTDSPAAWAWFGISLLIMLAASFAFCRWFAVRIVKKSLADRTFL